MSNVKIALGKLKMLEKQLGQMEYQISRCKEWVKGIRNEVKELESELFWANYPTEADETDDY